MKKVKFNLKTAMLSLLAVAGMAFSQQASAAETEQTVWCIKTNTGNFYPIARVSMTVVPDGGKTFDIILKDGEGESGVTSMSFEQHKALIDVVKYREDGPTQAPYVDTSKKCYLITNKGTYYEMKSTSLPTLKPKGEKTYDVMFGSKVEATDVEKIWFYRGDDPEHNLDGIFTPSVDEEEHLQLMTPISYQMEISGCGNAKSAEVYSTAGKQVAKAAVRNGVTTIQVGHLTSGVYVVKVGKKSLKFLKK